MARSYSLDLRERVFGAWQRGEGSQAAVAARFGVSVSFVRDLARRWRESGGVAPRARGGGRAPRVDAAAAAEAIRAAVAARHDATIEEHRQSLACINGPTTTAVFLACLDSLLVPHLWPGAVVVMDNLSAPKAKAVREKIEAAGARLLYLSPYRPDFNPMEMAWSKLKSHLRPSRRAHQRPRATRPSPRAGAPSVPPMPVDTSDTAATAEAYSIKNRSKPALRA